MEFPDRKGYRGERKTSGLGMDGVNILVIDCRVTVCSLTPSLSFSVPGSTVLIFGRGSCSSGPRVNATS